MTASKTQVRGPLHRKALHNPRDLVHKQVLLNRGLPRIRCVLWTLCNEDENQRRRGVHGLIGGLLEKELLKMKLPRLPRKNELSPLI